MDTEQMYQGTRIPQASDHQSVAIGAASARTAAALPAGLYSFEVDGCGAHVVLGGAACAADTTCLWIRNGGGRYQTVPTGFYVAVIRDAAGGSGTLHINRQG